MHIRNNRYILILILFISAYTQESQPDYPEFSLGIHGGMSAASMNGSEIDLLEDQAYEDGTMKTTGNVGVSCMCKLTRMFALQSGLEVAGKGFRILLDRDEATYVTTETYRQRNITSLEIPLLVRPILQKSEVHLSTFAFHVFIGPSFGLILSAKERWYVEITEERSEASSRTDTEILDKVNLMHDATWRDTLGHVVHYSYNDFYRHMAISLVAGFAFEKRFRAAGLFLEFRFVEGLLDFVDVSDEAKQELAAYVPTDVREDALRRNLGATCRSFNFNFGVYLYLKELKKKE